MTKQEQLAKFKTLYKFKENYGVYIFISTTSNKFVFTVYRLVEVPNKKVGCPDVAECSIFMEKKETIQETVEALLPYIERREGL